MVLFHIWIIWILFCVWIVNITKQRKFTKTIDLSIKTIYADNARNVCMFVCVYVSVCLKFPQESQIPGCWALTADLPLHPNWGMREGGRGGGKLIGQWYTGNGGGGRRGGGGGWAGSCGCGCKVLTEAKLGKYPKMKALESEDTYSVTYCVTYTVMYIYSACIPQVCVFVSEWMWGEPTLVCVCLCTCLCMCVYVMVRTAKKKRFKSSTNPIGPISATTCVLFVCLSVSRASYSRSLSLCLCGEGGGREGEAEGETGEREGEGDCVIPQKYTGKG